MNRQQNKITSTTFDTEHYPSCRFVFRFNNCILILLNSFIMESCKQSKNTPYTLPPAKIWTISLTNVLDISIFPMHITVMHIIVPALIRFQLYPHSALTVIYPSLIHIYMSEIANSAITEAIAAPTPPARGIIIILKNRLMRLRLFTTGTGR